MWQTVSFEQEWEFENVFKKIHLGLRELEIVQKEDVT